MREGDCSLGAWLEGGGAWPGEEALEGQKLDEGTGGVVARSYVTNLRKGRIESPCYNGSASSPDRQTLDEVDVGGNTVPDAPSRQDSGKKEGIAGDSPPVC